jgi:nitrite reductase (cytochrome c-552)
MSAENQPQKKRGLLIALVAGVFALVAIGAAALLVNITERKQEAKHTFVKLVEVTEGDVDAAKWGKNWPREFDGYQRTSEPTATKYGGGGHGANESQPPPQKSERDPWLKRVFAGYLFAIDYRDRRGHAFALTDQENTKRNVPAENKQSGNCLHCHASIMPLYAKLGAEAAPQASKAEQLQAGLVKVGELDYWAAHKQLAELSGGKAHPVSCVDCHDPQSMEIRVTRPGFIAGMQKLAAGAGAVPHLPSVERWRRGDKARPYDPNLDGTRQEKRSFVCGQCHVEYFCGKGMTILFPWAEGLKVEEMEHLYDGLQVKGSRFKDWTHAETGFEVLKAQHPEFEMWSQGIHARSGVACADCHMPYKRDGAQKISEHWVRSPLLSPNRSCAGCHPYGDDELKARVLNIQDRHFALMTRAGGAAVAMIDAIVAVRKPYDDKHREAATAKAREALEKTDGFDKLPKEEQDKKLAAATKANLLAAWREVVAKEPAIKELEELQRAAQWRLDYVAAENSMGFHAPQEMARILGESIDLSRQCQVKASALTGGTLAVAAPAATPAKK